MQTKIIELRDRNTFIPLLCVNMNPDERNFSNLEAIDAQRYLLRRAGYACDGRPIIAVAHACGGGPFRYDPYDWGIHRTFKVAHDYIQNHWEEINDGDVVDVEFILGETTTQKVSERIEFPI